MRAQIASDDPSADALIAHTMKMQREKAAKAKKAKASKKPGKHLHAVDHTAANDSPRQVDTRTEIDRDSDFPDQWKRSSNLEAPDPRPGFVQRWVRYKQGNEHDPENLEARLDEGWRPLKRARAGKSHALTADLKGKYGDYYVKRGLILCEMPERLFLQKREFFQKQKRQMTRSIDENMFKVDNRVMPLLPPERKTRVTKTARRGSLEASIPADE